MTFVLSPASWAMLRLPHAYPGPSHWPLLPTAWRRSSGPAAWPSSCRGAAGLSCSSTPVGTSPSQDILIPQTFSSSWQTPQCPDPDYRILPLMKVPGKFQRIFLWNAVFPESYNRHFVGGQGQDGYYRRNSGSFILLSGALDSPPGKLKEAEGFWSADLRQTAPTMCKG